MLRKKMVSIGKLGRKVKSTNATYNHGSSSTREALLESESESGNDSSSGSLGNSGSVSDKGAPLGFFAIYVGEAKERFLVPTNFLSHPLFKILLEKACEEFGFEYASGIVLPCSVSTFREVVDAIEGGRGRFDVGKLLEEFD